jgi:hypothetical protein
MLRHWQILGLLDRITISATQWQILEFIEVGIWRSAMVARAMLSELPKSERSRLARGCEKTAIERAVFFDLMRCKLRGCGLPGSDKTNITYDDYSKFLKWRRPSLSSKLTRDIFVAQRKSALAAISYANRTGTLAQLYTELREPIK